ncbi:MAG: alpha/beta hydrolase [Solirubrobacterales bacterium]
MPAIRLGGDEQPWEERERGPTARLRSRPAEIGGIETRAVSAAGEGAATVLLHGWLDNADTWLAVLDRLAVAGHPAIAYDLPGFGAAPALGSGSVLDQLVHFTAAAVESAAEASGREVVVAGNSLGGWVALRLAQDRDLPLAGIVPIGPAGVRMAPAFFTLDRIPAVSRIIGLPAPVTPAVVRSVAGGLYRRLAFADPAGVDPAVVDRFTRFHVDRPVIRERIEYAKRLRPELDDPFDGAAIEVPVKVIWGELDRLCPVSGAEQLAERLPAAEIAVLPGVGHTPQVEAPDLVVEAIAALAAGAAEAS